MANKVSNNTGVFRYIQFEVRLDYGVRATYSAVKRIVLHVHV